MSVTVERFQWDCNTSFKSWVVLIALTGLVSCSAPSTIPVDYTVSAVAETHPVPDGGDAADDPAIWLNWKDPEQTLILGTNKKGGLQVLNLDGSLVGYLAVGNLNNVDVREDPYADTADAIAVATQRNPSRLALFRLDGSNREVTHVDSFKTRLKEPYGLCMYLERETNASIPMPKLPENVQGIPLKLAIETIPYVIANSKDGTFVQYKIERSYSLTEVRSWRTNSQPEGCVVDDARHRIYIGEEEHGIWELDARPDLPAELSPFVDLSHESLVADIEGLALAGTKEKRILIVSSQGSSSFSLFRTLNGQYVGSFRIGTGDVDEVTETDGLAWAPLRVPKFPKGILVVQDDENTMPKENQNFKLVSWATVQDKLR